MRKPTPCLLNAAPRLAAAGFVVFAAYALAWPAPSKRPRAHGNGSATSRDVLVDCRALLDSVVRQYNSSDPSFLARAPETYACTDSQAYLIHYYRGKAFFLLTDWLDALGELEQAKGLGGPKDEEVLYFLWKINRELGDIRDQALAVFQLHDRFPNSPFLWEILNTPDRPAPPRRNWGFSTTHGVFWLNPRSYNPGFHVYDNANFELRQALGANRFTEDAGLGAQTKLEGMRFEGGSASFKAGYGYKDFSLSAGVGLGYNFGFLNRVSDSVITPAWGKWNLGEISVGAEQKVNFNPRTGADFGLQYYRPGPGYHLILAEAGLHSSLGARMFFLEAMAQHQWYPTGTQGACADTDYCQRAVDGYSAGDLSLGTFALWGKWSFDLAVDYGLSLDRLGPAPDNSGYPLLPQKAGYSQNFSASCGGKFSFTPRLSFTARAQAGWSREIRFNPIPVLDTLALTYQGYSGLDRAVQWRPDYRLSAEIGYAY